MRFWSPPLLLPLLASDNREQGQRQLSETTTARFLVSAHRDDSCDSRYTRG